MIVREFPGAEHVNGWRTIPEMSRDRLRGDSVAGSGAEGAEVAPDALPAENSATAVAA